MNFLNRLDGCLDFCYQIKINKRNFLSKKMHHISQTQWALTEEIENIEKNFQTWAITVPWLIKHIRWMNIIQH